MSQQGSSQQWWYEESGETKGPVGAKVSLGATASSSEFRKTQIELGVNAAVVLALVIGLILIRRTDHR